MNKQLIVLSVSLLIGSLPAFADDSQSGTSGVVNGANINDFLGSGPVINRDAMDESAERQNRNSYLDQDPANKAHISLPAGAYPIPPSDNTNITVSPVVNPMDSTAANTTANGAGDKVLHDVGEVFNPNILIDLGLGRNKDTDQGKLNLNKDY